MFEPLRNFNVSWSSAAGRIHRLITSNGPPFCIIKSLSLFFLISCIMHLHTPPRHPHPPNPHHPPCLSSSISLQGSSFLSLSMLDSSIFQHTMTSSIKIISNQLHHLSLVLSAASECTSYANSFANH